jgi:hypothetical protein
MMRNLKSLVDRTARKTRRRETGGFKERRSRQQTVYSAAAIALA